MRKKALFMVLDGPDGCGKSTQAALLADWLRSEGLEVLLVRDPGSTQIGEAVRRIILDRRYSEMSAETELLLYMACRAQLVREAVLPALSRGVSVVADRFLSSSVVYQGVALGVPIKDVIRIGRFATMGLVPDLTIILDLPAAAGLARKTGEPDRIECRGEEFQERVRKGFIETAAMLPGPVTIIDASGTAGDVAASVREAAAGIRKPAKRAGRCR